MSANLRSSLSIMQFPIEVLWNVLKYLPYEEQGNAEAVSKLFQQNILNFQKDVAEKLCIKSHINFNVKCSPCEIRQMIINHEVGFHYLPNRFVTLLSNCRKQLFCAGKAERAYALCIGNEMARGTVSLSLKLIPDGVKLAIDCKGDICVQADIEFPEIRINLEDQKGVIVSMEDLENKENDYNQFIVLLNSMKPEKTIPS